MTEFTFENVKSYSYKSALSHGAVFIDGFRNDFALSHLVPQYFGENASVQGKEREQVLESFGRLFGRKGLLDIASGKSFLCNAIEGDQVVGTCLVDYPKEQRPKLTVWQKLKYYFYFAYVVVATCLDGSPQKKIVTPELGNFYRNMKIKGGAVQKEDYTNKLCEMTADQLEKTLYPLDKTLYVHILSVSRKGQGKGYGSQLLLHSLSMYKEHQQVFKGPNGESIGPAKASLYPSHGKTKFYEKYGFRVAFETPSEIPGTESDSFKMYQFMQKVL